MGRSLVGQTYIVKDTLVELQQPCGEGGIQWSNESSVSETTARDESSSFCSSLPTPVEQEDCVLAADTEYGETTEPFNLACIATPSPFLYPSAPMALPPDYNTECGMMLPPAFEGNGMVLYEMMGSDPMGVPFSALPPMMYDASTDMYVPCGWGPVDYEAAGAVDQGFVPVGQEDGEGLGGIAGREAAGASSDVALPAADTDAGHEQPPPTPPGDEGVHSAGDAAGEEVASWSQGDGKAESSGGGSQLQASSDDCAEPDSIWSGAGTTVMLRNIPNKYTRDMLVAQLNEDLRGEFDFVYLPIDFKNRCNVGYCFIDFRSIAVRDRFVQAFDGVEVQKCLPGLNSKKIAEVAPARVHGLEDNVKRLRNSPVMNELIGHPEWMPLIFDEDGLEMPFPLPDRPVPAIKPGSRRRQEAGEAETVQGGAGRGGRGRKESGGGRSWKGRQSQAGQAW